MSDQSGVRDLPDRHRFVLGGAKLVYRAEPRRLVLVHTEVPEELGGRGTGGRLVAAAVERARATGEVLAPWCPYARSWLERRPEQLDGVTVDWSAPPS